MLFSTQTVGEPSVRAGTSQHKRRQATPDPVRLEPLENRWLLASTPPVVAAEYAQTNLVSDGAVSAALTDPNLVNSWGLAASPTGPFWVSDNGTGVATIYTGDGTKVNGAITVPAPSSSTSGTSAPTGVVFNPTQRFAVTANGTTAPAQFIYVTEDGTIAGFNSTVDATSAVQVVDNSANGAIYKGVALASKQGRDLLYATDFHNGTIDVFNKKFKSVSLADDFTDSTLPAGFAPFNIQLIGNRLFVTFAKQDATAEDDVAGVGNGFVDVFRKNGTFVKRFASQGTLNSPWGLAMAPANFGVFSGDLLVGNFGDGLINAFDPSSGKFLGQMQDASGQPLVIDGLWALKFGNGAAAGSPDTLFFTAGPNGEANGLFGKLDPVPPNTTIATSFAIQSSDQQPSSTSDAPNPLLA